MQQISNSKQILKIIDAISDGIIIIDKNGTVVLANSAIKSLIDLSSDELVGTTIDSMPITMTSLEAEFKNIEENPFIKMTAQKNIKNQFYKFNKQDGSIVFLRINSSSLYDDSGIERSTIFTLTDITKIKMDEMQLDMMSLAVEFSPNPVIITNIDAIIEYVNPRFTELTGYTAKEAVGQNPRILKSDQTPQSTYDELWDLLPKGKIWRGEFINKMKNGRTYRQNSAIAPVVGADGVIKHYVAVIEDVTKQRETEASLIESERRLREIFEKSFILAVMLDLDGNITYANSLFLNLADQPKENVIGKPLDFFISSEHCEDLDYAIAESVSTCKSGSRLVCDMFTSHNERRTISMCVVVLHNTQGDIIGTSVIGEDVTEATRAAKEIRDSRKQVLDILESISDSFFALDDSWRFTYINKHAERILDTSRTGLLFRDMRKSIPRLTADKLLKLCKDAKAEMKSISSDEYFSSIDSWYEVRVFPYEHGISVYLSDITDRKIMEKQMIILTNKVQSLLDSTYEGIYGLDANGNCTFFNKSASKMLGYTPEEIIGKDAHVIIHHSHQDGSPYPKNECPIVKTYTEGKRVRINAEVYWRKDGIPVPVEYSSYPIHNDGSFIGAVVTFSKRNESS